MNKDIAFTPKQVGQRIKERRNEINISMPELGRRVGVNKSTIQRYETDGVDPKRTMIINGLAEALLTTPEWLTGLSDEKEYNSKTLCQMDIEKHIAAYLDELTATVKGEPHQQLLTMADLGGERPADRELFLTPTHISSVINVASFILACAGTQVVYPELDYESCKQYIELFVHDIA